MTTRHLIASWSDNQGRRHARCECGTGTPPPGALTRETAESFVAHCRAAQSEHIRRDDDQTRSPIAEPVPAAGRPADASAGASAPETVQAISGARA